MSLLVMSVFAYARRKVHTLYKVVHDSVILLVVNLIKSKSLVFDNIIELDLKQKKKHEKCTIVERPRSI